ncbi:MAG: hypothetical protein PUK40_05390 [Actinomycetaceae bacterium]|nr:hypothetical protein [Arcanobacterium sp.]MDD7505364.1 hypothetical protein [Actinomycetaceae bacterium]MDY6142751.1 hypothetical protein [Arcanobacterium sp.]
MAKGDGLNHARAAGSHLTDDDIAKMRRIQRRNLVIGVVLGIVLLVLGFFAGRAIREQHDASQDYSAVAVHSLSARVFVPLGVTGEVE